MPNLYLKPFYQRRHPSKSETQLRMSFHQKIEGVIEAIDSSG